MNVEALDHVNIITDRMNETADFYGQLLGLERRNAPPPLTPQNATWMFDAEGRAIIHINTVDCPRTFDREVQPGSLTGALTAEAFRPSSAHTTRSLFGLSTFHFQHTLCTSQNACLNKTSFPGMKIMR